MYPIILEIPDVWALTDDKLHALCMANRDKAIERNAQRQILIMSPTGKLSSSYHANVLIDLGIWNRKSQLGVIFDSSGGFLLPNGAMRSPDAAWIRKERWEALTDAQKEKFPPLCPDFIIELRSSTDSLTALQQKMAEWMENGCQLAWLIDPEFHKAYIYRPAQQPEIISGFNATLCGENVLPGFLLPLEGLK